MQLKSRTSFRPSAALWSVLVEQGRALGCAPSLLLQTLLANKAPPPLYDLTKAELAAAIRASAHRDGYSLPSTTCTFANLTFDARTCSGAFELKVGKEAHEVVVTLEGVFDVRPSPLVPSPSSETC